MRRRAKELQLEDQAVVPIAETPIAETPIAETPIAETTVVGPAAIMQAIQSAAANPEVDIDKMERLWDMHKQLVDSQNEAAFNGAMNAAQGEMRLVSADARNPQTHSEYASYAALDKALRPIYVRHGFSLSFYEGETSKPEHIRIMCDVAHSGGCTKKRYRDMPADGKGAKGGDVMTKTHASGAAATYGMRYLLKMIFNVAIGEDDNDGNEAIETIDNKQLADLEALMTEVGADKKAFLKVCQVQSFDQLPAAQYSGAVQRLEQKRKQ